MSGRQTTLGFDDEPDTYRTLAETSEAFYKDRGSKFLSFVFPVSSEAGFKEALAALKDRFPDASHHCWALVLGEDRSFSRSNDDGEPAYSAGKPILNALKSFEVTNAGAVVVRYFGGTKLGVRGLIDAYRQSTEEALHNNRLVERPIRYPYELHFGYEILNDVMNRLKHLPVDILEQTYDEGVCIRLEVPKKAATAFEENWQAFPQVQCRPIG